MEVEPERIYTIANNIGINCFKICTVNSDLKYRFKLLPRGPLNSFTLLPGSMSTHHIGGQEQVPTFVIATKITEKDGKTQVFS